MGIPQLIYFKTAFGRNDRVDTRRAPIIESHTFLLQPNLLPSFLQLPSEPIRGSSEWLEVSGVFRGEGG